jgi:cobalt/nickel transport system permease protein
LHHAVVERWSRGASPLHRRDPRAKIVALLALLVVLATTHRGLAYEAGAMFLLLCGLLRWAALPVAAGLRRAAVVLPFAGAFALLSWVAGDPARGAALLTKTYLSAIAVLLLVSTTPLPRLLRGLERTGAPRFLLMVAQFLYRYLFVISEEGQHMAKAARSRGADLRRMGGSTVRFRGAAGALAVLFAKSYGRAEQIHRAMLARGFAGRLEPLETLHFGWQDAAFATIGTLALFLIRVAAERAL